MPARGVRRPQNVFLKVQASVLATVCVLAGILLVQTRNDADGRARAAAHSLTSALAAHVGDLVALYDDNLKFVADAIEGAGGDVVPPTARQIIASAVTDRAKALRLLAVLNAKGDLVFESVTSHVRQANFADRDYFQAQAHSSVGLFVSRPFIGRLDGQLEIALSRRLAHKDGSFAGVAFGVIKLSMLKDMFDAATLAADGSVSLMRSDGVVLMRKPYRDGYIGRNVGTSPLFTLAKASPAGFFEGAAAIDGIDRLYAFSRVGELPLVMSVGASKAELFDVGDHRALSLGALILLLASNVLLLAGTRGRKTGPAAVGAR